MYIAQNIGNDNKVFDMRYSLLLHILYPVSNKQSIKIRFINQQLKGIYLVKKNCSRFGRKKVQLESINVKDGKKELIPNSHTHPAGGGGGAFIH